MARITIIYDEGDPPMLLAVPDAPTRTKIAKLDVDRSEKRDIYEVARKLAELLLEQLDA